MFWKRLILKKLRPRKISWKLTISYAVLFSAVLIALNAGTLFGVRFYLREQAKFQVSISTQNTLGVIASAPAKATLSSPEYLDEAETVPAVGIRITDPAGVSVVSSAHFPAGMPGPNQNPGAASLVERGDRHYELESSRIERGGVLLGYLQVTYDMVSEYRFIKLLFIFTAIADALGVAASVLAGFLLSRRALRPIDSLTNAAARISSGDLKQRVEVGRADDEMTRLAATFNGMIEKLQAAFEKQTRFVSDASHELRTPIAVIQGYADLIEKWAKDDPKVLEESVAAIHKEAKGMTGMIEELLLLARGDSGKLCLKKEAVPLAGLLEEIAGESRLIAPNRIFGCRAPEDLLLLADRGLLKRALRALIDNAMKYTPENGHILLEASASGGEVILSVQDNGVGIPEEEQPKLFDRFYRVDKNRSKETGGSGLGLAIVKSIAEAHGGTVAVQSKKGGGTKVNLRLPEYRGISAEE